MRKTFFLASALLVLVSLSGCGGNKYLTRAAPPTDAKVVVVEFFDFICPACRRGISDTLAIKNTPGVYFEYRHFPLDMLPGHQNARLAANSYECAASQNYGKEMYLALFDNSENLSLEVIKNLPESYLFGAEFDQADFIKCLDENRYAATINADDRAAQNAGINSTPSFVVNGKIVSGISALREAVAAALAE